MTHACSSTTSPAGVRATCRLLRSKSWTPNSCSSAMMRFESEDCETYKVPAATVKEPASTIAMKSSKSMRHICAIETQDFDYMGQMKFETTSSQTMQTSVLVTKMM